MPAATYTPGSREVVAAIIEMWKVQPDTENLGYAKLLDRLKAFKAQDNWALSEKRMKACLKEFNIEPNKPPFTYVKDTISSKVDGLTLPEGIKIEVTKARGKAVYTTKPFAEGELIWTETPLVQAAQVDRIRLMRAGACCSYCAKILKVDNTGKPVPKMGIPCNMCQSNWCSKICKDCDVAHKETIHEIYKSNKPKVMSNKWKIYEQFCLEQSWNAGYLYGVTLLHLIHHGKESHYAKVIDGLAKIKQDHRQRAVSEPDSLEYEQVEQMWKMGYKLLSEAVSPVMKLSYDEFLMGLGAVNMNNVSGCIFEIHSNLNHSCDPNVKVVFRETSKAHGIDVIATKPIDVNQELLTTYVNPEFGLDKRAYNLRINYGFICNCSRCKLEKSGGANTKNENTHSESQSKSSEEAKDREVHFEEGV